MARETWFAWRHDTTTMTARPKEVRAISRQASRQWPGIGAVQMDEERYDIIIAGGGAVGLTLACALVDALGRP